VVFTQILGSKFSKGSTFEIKSYNNKDKKMPHLGQKGKVIDSNIKNLLVKMKELKKNMIEMTLAKKESTSQKVKVEEELSTFKGYVLRIHVKGFNQDIL